MSNAHWLFLNEAMRDQLGLQTLVVVNDFTALAMALPRLTLHKASPLLLPPVARRTAPGKRAALPLAHTSAHSR